MYGATRRGAGVVELARLESVYGGNVIEGSNPSLSAKEVHLIETHYIAGNLLIQYLSSELILSGINISTPLKNVLVLS